MSVTGISSSSMTQINDAQYYRDRVQQIRNGFQQLGTDLQAGNLSQAQQDFATLSQNISSAQQQNNSSVDQDFISLGQALQSGNVSDAQKAYSALVQDLQQASARVHHHRHHRHHTTVQQGASSSDAQQSSPIAQAFDSLGKALQSGDLSGAQQAYATIIQDLQQYGLNASAVSSASAAAQAPGSNLNVTT
jgi:hypothetical protein